MKNKPIIFEVVLQAPKNWDIFTIKYKQPNAKKAVICLAAKITTASFLSKVNGVRRIVFKIQKRLP
jgi:hypothetical protein